VSGGEYFLGESIGLLCEATIIGSVLIAELVVEQGGGVDIRLFAIGIWCPLAGENSARIVSFGQFTGRGPSKIRKTNTFEN
jgi:hypothetical protein